MHEQQTVPITTTTIKGQTSWYVNLALDTNVKLNCRDNVHTIHSLLRLSLVNLVSASSTGTRAAAPETPMPLSGVVVQPTHDKLTKGMHNF